MGDQRLVYADLRTSEGRGLCEVCGDGVAHVLLDGFDICAPCAESLVSESLRLGRAMVVTRD